MFTLTTTYERDGKTFVVPTRRDEHGVDDDQLNRIRIFTQRANATAARAARARANA